MSLFVGNISARVSQSDLEHIFRRFGRSNLELKDGYGFVVYDAVNDAEKALRALKGRIICGEQLSITWSRKQRPLRRFSGKQYPRRSYVNRDLRKEDDIKGKCIKEWEETAKDMQKYACHEEEAAKQDGFICIEGRDNGCEKDSLGEKGKHQNLEEVLLDERCAVEPIPLENDRWGEPLSEASNEHDMGKEATDLLRYDPCSSDNRNGGDGYESEKHWKVKTNDCYAANSSSERVLKCWSRDETRTGHRGFGGSPERCYKCGRVGHVMRHCRLKAVVCRRDKFKRVGHSRNGERYFRENGFTRSKGPIETDRSKLGHSTETVLLRKDFISEIFMGHAKERRHHHRTERFSEVKQKHTRHLSNDRNGDQTRENTRRKHKKLRTDSASRPTGRRGKSHSFPHSESQHDTHSNSSSSCSQSSFSRSHSSMLVFRSASSPPCSRSPSPHAKSRSSISRSMSSHTRSQLVSSRSRCAKPISKSRPHSETPKSLSASLSPCVQKSPFPTLLRHGLCGSYDVTVVRQSLNNILPSESHFACSEQISDKSNANAHREGEDKSLSVKIENDLRVRIIEDDEKEEPDRNINDSGIIIEDDGKEEPDRNINDSGIFISYEGRGKRDAVSLYREVNAHSDEASDEHDVLEGDIMKGDMTRSSALENAEIPVETTIQPVVDNLRTAPEKRREESLLGNVSLQEVKMVVEHSKGSAIEEIEHKSSVESYLGAARLWPWEVIQYRRLKRGAISIANYARRKDQNEMFGIVDKYVRSSSGWWEIQSHEF